MANVVEVTFSGKDDLTPIIERIRGGATTIERSAQTAGAAMDQTLRRTQAQIEASDRLARQNAAGFNQRIEQIEKENSAVERQRALIERLARERAAQIRNERQAALNIPPGGPVAGFTDPFNVRPDRTSAATLSDRAVVARFNAAARGEVEQYAGSIDKATAAQQRFHGASIVGTSILRSFGVDGSRALEVVGNQVLNLGVKLEDILSNKLIRFTLAAAAGLAFKELADSVAEVNKQVAEFNTQSATFGTRGGLQTRVSELQKLQQIAKELREQEVFGRAGGLLEESLRQKGIYGISGEQAFIEQSLNIKRPEQTFGTNFRDAFIEQVRGVTGGQLGIDVPGLLGFQTLAEQSQKLNSTLKDRHDIEERIREVMLQQKQIEDELGIAAARHAAIRYQTVEQQGQLDQQLQRISNEVEEENRKANERQRHIKEEAGIAITGLRRQLDSSNPFDSLYDRAEQRQREFLERFKEVPGTIKDEFERLNEELKQLDIFKGKLNLASHLNDIITEKAKLDAGLAGQDLRNRASSDAAQRATIEQQIYEERRSGTLTPQRQQELLDQYAKVGLQSPLDRINQEKVDRDIQTAQSAFGSAKTPEQQQAAIEFGLRATSNIGGLSGTQADFRAKLLNQSAVVDQQVLQRQQEREDKRADREERYIKAMEAHTAALTKGFAIDFNATITDDGNRAETTGKEPSPFDGGYATGIRGSDFRNDSRFVSGGGGLSNDF